MLSHINKKNEPRMVNVSHKESTLREASAEARMTLPPEVLNMLQNNEIQTQKGPVFQTAIIAGTMAAKQTGAIIPLCHPLVLTGCEIDISTTGNELKIISMCSIHHKTGVEMEALTAVSVAALTVYDMCKCLSHEMVIKEIRLLEKRK